MLSPSPVRPKVVAQPLDPELTVIIPAYNEQQRLGRSLGQLARFLDEWGVNHRVIVADDGSSDQTAKVAEEFGPRFTTLRLRHAGKGAAVRAAMLRPNRGVVAFTDADLPYDLTALLLGYQWIAAGECRVVFGARDLPDSQQQAPTRLSRRMATFCFRTLVRRLISPDVPDTQCGLKLFHHEAARDIFSRTTIDGFAFDAEVVALTQRLGWDYRRLPVRLVNDYDSSLSLSRHTMPILADLVRIWWRFRSSEGQQELATTPVEFTSEAGQRYRSAA